MDHLAAAAHALRVPPDRQAALEHLVLAWREHQRHPELAELVEALAAESTRALVPLDLTLADADFHTAWIARASRAALLDVDVLLPGLFRGPLGKKIRQRFDMILPFADDPRVTAAFGRMIAEPPVMAASNFSLWTQLFTALTRAPDVRLRPILERTVVASQGDSQFWPMLAQRSLTLLHELPKQLPELAPEVHGRIAELHERIAELASAPPPTTAPGEASQHTEIEAQLLAKIHAEPHALEHRMVWADALLAGGDPRGEFVSLQLARSAGGTASKRERQLLAQYELAWLGELAAVVDRKSVRWINGFPVAAEVVFDSQAQRNLIGDEIWATFEELECDDLELIESPTLRSLKRVGRLSLATLVALVEARGAALPIEQLGPIALLQNPPAEFERLRAAAAERLTNVRELRLHLPHYAISKRPGDFEWLFATPLGKRLTSFRLSAILVSHIDENATPWAEWAAAVHGGWPKIERIRLDMGVISIEMADRKLTVRTQLQRVPFSHHDEDAREQIGQLRGHFDQLEIISCSLVPLDRQTAASWSEAGGFAEFVHTHARSNEPISGLETSRVLGKSANQQRKAKSRIARAARQTRTEPPPPRRYGPGATGAWLAHDGPERHVHFRWSWKLAFSPEGGELLVVGWTFVALSVPDLSLAWSLRDTQQTLPCSFVIDGDVQRMWIGAGKGATILWDLRMRRELARARLHRNRVNAVAIRGERMYSADIDRKLHCWQYTPGQNSTEPIMLVPDRAIGLDIAPVDMALDPAGTTLALLAADQVQWRDPDDLACRPMFRATVRRASSLGWSPRGDHFVVGSEDGTITVWHCDGTQLTSLRVHDRRLGGFAWTPDGDHLITIGDDERGPAIGVIDCDTGQRVATITPSAPSQLGRVACSPDGRLLAVGAYDWVRCWTLADGAEVGVWRAT
jgi:uncharacterized protein (TIGR02996 family)